MDISRMKFCLDNAEHQIKIQETHINRTGRAPCNDLCWIQSVYDRLTDGPPKTTDAAVQTTASGECGFTLPSQPAKVVHGTQAYNDELIEAWRSSQRSCVISCPSRTSSGRLAIFTNTRRSPTHEQDAQSTAAAASALPLRYGFPPGVRMAPGFPPNTTWYRSA